MKHKPKIILILIVMFVITQFIGLYVVNYYSDTRIVEGEKLNITSPELPLGLEMPDVQEESDFWTSLFPSIIIAFIIAISIFFMLTKFKAEFILKLWFFIVVLIALILFFYTITGRLFYERTILFGLPVFATLIALPLAYFKIYGKNLLTHNITELLVYPGIAAVFVPILNIYTAIALLLIISVYDMWAVWRSGIMQKMAKYQMEKLNIIGGFMIPYMSKKTRDEIRKLRESKKNNKTKNKKTKNKNENKRIRVNLAILGGGDVIFPIIISGVVLKTLGYLNFGTINIPLASILIILGATAGLSGLFLFSEKKKFYPAMPFITIGILVGLGLSYLIYFLI